MMDHRENHPSASLIVIPARLESTRLPRKLLLQETGKPLIQHTYEAACRATRPGGVCVATDAEEIYAAVLAFGGEVCMTGVELRSGTDRVAEVARQRPDVEIFINVQGDEPEISAAAIDSCLTLLEENPNAAMSTAATPIRSRQQLEDPACVKVVFDDRRRAMYFSRSPIPCAREWDDALLERTPPLFYQHVGLYAYRREQLLQLAAMPRTDLETVESLEQLRALAAGDTILVTVIHEPTIGIDTREDYEAFVQRTIAALDQSEAA